MAGAFQHSAFESDFQYTAGADAHDPGLPRRRREWPQSQVIRQSDLRRKLGILPGKRIPARERPVEYEYVPEEAPGPSPEQLAEDDRVIAEYLAQSYAERQTAISQALGVVGEKLLKDSKETLH